MKRAIACTVLAAMVATVASINFANSVIFISRV